MGVVTDIVATYRQPRRVMRRLLSMGKREDRALAFVMAGCTVVFMSQWPILARQAHLEKQDLNMLLGAALLAWIILAPLLLYGLSGLTQKRQCFCCKAGIILVFIGLEPVNVIERVGRWVYRQGASASNGRFDLVRGIYVVLAVLPKLHRRRAGTVNSGFTKLAVETVTEAQ